MSTHNIAITDNSITMYVGLVFSLLADCTDKLFHDLVFPHE